ncbi:MAG TPA: hypothetical protein EYQ81_07675 [Sneathiellales bacterium]|nr:hypothetical protein [Sneathiellales bacterium]
MLEVEQRLAAVKEAGLSLVEIEPAHFRHPDLDDHLAGILEELMFGRGMVVLRGLPADRYSAEDMAMMYWGIGTHFGIAVSQSAMGDVLGHVQDLTKPGEEEDARGYTSARELRLHTDLAQVAGLFCYRPAARGGVSVIASALAMHNQIAAEHPEYLPIYYRGFPYHRRGEQAPEAEAVTPHAVPVFSTLKGNTSVFYVREILQNGAEERGVPLTDEEVAALDYFDACARDNSYRLRLGQGDALFMNNRTTLHARTKFENGDGPDGERHLMRLWLDVPGKRPDVPEIQVYENQGGRSGIDHQVGQVRAGAKYRTMKAAE